MNPLRLLPDDPKLTAYALGELSGDERAAVEAALRRDPALRAAVEEIRATAAQLEAAFADESAAATNVPFDSVREEKMRPFAASSGPAFTSPPSKRRRVAVEASDEAEKTNVEAYPIPQSKQNLLRIPQIYYVIGAAAAACFALIVTLRQPPPSVTVVVHAPPAEGRIYREIPLAPPVQEPADAVAALPVPASSVEPAALPAPVLPVVAPSAPAFVEGGLSLLAQNRNESGERRTAESGVEPGIVALPHTPVVTRDESLVASRAVETTASPTPAEVVRESEPAPSVIPVKAVATAAPSAAARPADLNSNSTAKLHFTAIPPKVGETVSSELPLGGLVLGTNSLALATSVTASPGTADTMVMSAMKVSANRAVGFATGSTEDSLSGQRGGVFDRGYLPRPPAAAKFVRGREEYSHSRDNDFLRAARHRESTFSIDVDTASYANVRRIIEHGSPPPRDAVRIEELVNYFPYRYPAPKGSEPIAATLEVAEAPWAPAHRLVRIGLKARDVPNSLRPAASLVFLLDVSSSMNQPNKLPLVKQSLRRLIGRLRADDRVAIVTYAGQAGLVLPSTPVARSREILNALDTLSPSPGSNGASGIQLAYDIAQENFRKDATTRVILCTDGDFDLGIASEGDLIRFIEQKASTGVALSVLGFGMGNYKDATLEKLASSGNGSYGYIDTPREAEKLLVEQISSTLVTVAKDVKIQVVFNPAKVASYRLIGYENRLLRKEDFNLDKVDAGEIGAGHTVTALYEIIPVGVADKFSVDEPPLDELRYAAQGAVSSRLEMPDGARDPLSNELLAVKVRFKKPDGFLPWPRTLEFPLLDAKTSFAKASDDFRFAAAVAQFGMILRDSPYRGSASMKDVAEWATHATTAENDAGGYRGEFIELVRKTQTMME